MKSKERFLLHQWTLSAAVTIGLIAVFLVMLPTIYRFYTDPDVMLMSNMSITTIIHAAIGIPAIVTSLLYAFGHLPTRVRKWMRLTAILWIAEICVGFVLYLQMIELI